MSIPLTVSAPLSFIQWAATAIASILVGSLAFFWRLAIRVDRFESALASQARFWDANVSASGAAMLRLADRLDQLHEDHFALRESLGQLPTQSDLRDVEDRVVAQVAALAGRLDRSLEKSEG